MNGPGSLFATVFGSHTVTDESFGDRTDLELFEQEEMTLAQAAPDRLAEFRTARSCAREALRILGEPKTSIPVGADRAPVWPAGIVGSITHCVGYRAAVVAKGEHVLAVGVDAEPDAPLPPGIAEATFTAGETAATRGLPAGANWDRLLFSAKEAIFKLQTQLGPTPRIEITEVDADGTIQTTPGPAGVRIDARWATGRGLIVTAATAHRVTR
ncbi:4'-phosphopantetheinyl transferase superfamily protein [Curtobacterium sp. MCPF17_002]|uniref:4'-phosphopantetheinyl transferase family protein n=1 Tax=Curtobacterium sp. MCPF17_002 TaxID=2175645 RepID=UPI000DA7EE04|nr:4'-phosphopantetheinyl transferase superfamily protein [Curtobacterium sp. MCPF17_002]WIB75839.1 4'-phosphopantetheinyl transferase superfamily protein [Curtobacterium sp. MCPF17_002]